MITEKMKEEIGQVLAGCCDLIRLRIHSTGEYAEQKERLRALAEELACSAEGLIAEAYEEAPNDIGPGYPSMEVIGKEGGGVHYSCLPTEKEWKPFLKTLAAAGGAENSERLRMDDSHEETPHLQLEVFITPICPHCPSVVEAINKLTYANPHIQTWVVNAMDYMDRAEALGIRSTPAIVVNGVVRWVGQAKEGDILPLLKSGSEAWVSTMKSHLSSGALELALAAARADKDAMAVLPFLLTEPEVGIHVGVLSAIEELALNDKGKALQLCGPLCDLLGDVSPQTRGDAAYGLGLLGVQEAVKPLEACLDDQDPDVRETVKDALEMIRELAESSE